MAETRASKVIKADIVLNVTQTKQKQSLIRRLTSSILLLTSEKEELQALKAKLERLISEEGNNAERAKLLESYDERLQEIDALRATNSNNLNLYENQLQVLLKDGNELNKELEDSLAKELEAKIRLRKTLVNTTDSLNKTLLYPSSLTIVKNTNLEVLTEGKYVYIKLGEISDLIGETVLREIDYTKVSFSNGDDTAKYYTTSYSYDLTIEPTSVFLLFDYENLRTNNTIWALLPQNPYNP